MAVRALKRTSTRSYSASWPMRFGRVLTLHDVVVEGMLLSREPDDLQRQGRTCSDARRNCPHATFSLEPNSQFACNVADCSGGRARRNATPAFVGRLELGDEEEVSIVFQEALRYSIIRLVGRLFGVLGRISSLG
ncbi:hypothetical protein EMCG_03981 [[Emmonsia] crescens]|uniref:Uncharacterized protein n=1 Tax=[Emmonsia] crescens TaxID=73230 RepID=A0A0G2HUG5_9EURO|nr:hypothetical protein EMCG_03981 [Emmonsia crescens UAMH 3008]